MGLLDEFRNEGVRPRVRCQVIVILEAMTETDADDLKAALADATVTAAAIERVLNRRNIKLSQGTIARHRRGECSCD